MSHPLIEVLDMIQEAYELDLEAPPYRALDKYEERKIAAFEARDLAVAAAVRDAILERNRLGWEKFPALNLKEIIKGVK